MMTTAIMSACAPPIGIDFDILGTRDISLICCSGFVE
jgi:hypothetical protein